MKDFEYTVGSARPKPVFAVLQQSRSGELARSFGFGRKAEKKPAVQPMREPRIGRVNVAVLSFENIHKYGELFSDFMHIRKQIFIEKRGWSLPHTNEIEFDQYDNPFSRWLVIYQYGSILGGVRITSTMAECGIYSYMLRDAQRGLLDMIPPDILAIEAPVSPRVCEASRIFVTDEVPANRRGQIQSLLITEMAKAASDIGAEYIVGLVPKIWPRWIRRLGFEANAIGPLREIDKEVCQAGLIRTSLPRIKPQLPSS